MYLKKFLSKFLPLLIPLEAEVCSGFPCWRRFSVVHMLEKSSSRNTKTREANSLVCMHWSSCLINASYSICSWIHPSKCLLKYQHSYLAHSLGLLLPFACFLKKAPGYLSAKKDNSFLDLRKIGGFTSWRSACSMLPEQREEGRQSPSRLHLYRRDHCISEERIICCRRICSLS